LGYLKCSGCRIFLRLRLSSFATNGPDESGIKFSWVLKKAVLLQNNRSFKLKSKVIVGFSLVLITVIGATVVAYDSYEKLSDAVSILAQPDHKLEQIDSLLMNINAAENVLQEYTISRSPGKLRNYDQLVGQIEDKVGELQSQSSFDNAELDSILHLINMRLVSMDEFREIRERRNESRFYERALKELEDEAVTRPDTVASLPKDKDSLLNQKQVPSPDTAGQAVESQDDAPQVEKERQGVLRWIGKLFSRQQEEDNQTAGKVRGDSASSQAEPEQERLPGALGDQLDTIEGLTIDSVRNMLRELQSEQAETEEYLNRQELSLLTTNRQVIERINQLLSGLRQERQQMYRKQSAEARQVLQHSLSRLGIILLVALLATLLFVYLIFADIAKSDFLKRQLEQARARAEELARVKEDFLANMSHEIRTPLTAIMGFTAALKKGARQPGQEEQIQAIDRSSQHLLSLVNDILDFSKIEAGQLRFEHEAFDLSQLLREVCTDMRFKAEAKNLYLRLEPEAETGPYLKGDAFRLRQVLYNLLSNAIKFTEEGGIILRCKLSELNAELLNVQLEVEDSGIGIPPEKQASIFEAFTQSDVSDTRKYGGTGLGLSITRKIVEAQGGEVALESQPGRGSTFFIALAFEMMDAETFTALAAANDNEPAEMVFQTGSKVLAIDDDPLNIRLLEMLVKPWGIQLFSALNGEEGVMMAARHKPALILTDLQMPGMTGWEVVSAIREMQIPDVPIVAFTARVTEEPGYFTSRGFADVLHKPFDETSVVKIMHRYLGDAAIDGEPEALISGEAVEPDRQDTVPALSFSLKNVLMFTGDDEEALRDFLISFQEVIEEAIVRMEVAIEAEDTDAIAEYAHKVLPNIQQLEVHELAVRLRELEAHRGQDASMESVRPAVIITISHLRELSEGLRRHIHAAGETR
jgi:signal transduction histidine kinase/ActR/RegA family two-component response regulator